jgi:hypothetical protein
MSYQGLVANKKASISPGLCPVKGQKPSLGTCMQCKKLTGPELANTLPYVNCCLAQGFSNFTQILEPPQYSEDQVGDVRQGPC